MRWSGWTSRWPGRSSRTSERRPRGLTGPHVRTSRPPWKSVDWPASPVACSAIIPRGFPCVVPSSAAPSCSPRPPRPPRPSPPAHPPPRCPRPPSPRPTKIWRRSRNAWTSCSATASATATFQVPAGVRLVIDYISADIGCAVGGSVLFDVATYLNGAEVESHPAGVSERRGAGPAGVLGELDHAHLRGREHHRHDRTAGSRHRLCRIDRRRVRALRADELSDPQRSHGSIIASHSSLSNSGRNRATISSGSGHIRASVIRPNCTPPP